MKHLLIGLLFALAACTSAVPAKDAPAATSVAQAPAPSTPVSDSVKAAAASDPAACAALNGTIRPICRMQRMSCVIAFRDAGRTCSNDTDCEGKCLLTDDAPTDPNTTVTGQCQANSNPCGCRSEVNGGKVTTTICVD